MLLVNASPGTRSQGGHISTLVYVNLKQSLHSLSQIMHSNATSTQRTYISARNLPPTLPTPNTRIPVHYYPSPSPNTSSNLPPLTPNPHIEQRTATTLNRPQAQHAPSNQLTPPPQPHLAQRTQTALPVYHLLIHLPSHTSSPRNPPSLHNYDHNANTTATKMTPPLHPPFTGWFCHLCSSINPPVAWNAGTAYQPRCMVR